MPVEEGNKGKLNYIQQIPEKQESLQTMLVHILSMNPDWPQVTKGPKGSKRAAAVSLSEVL